MNENNNKGRGVFYGVIGVATLVVAIIGATFAYFTASQNAGNNVIGGNMATIGFNLEVTKVLDPGEGSGMIPMSNSMVEPAVSKIANTGGCTDDAGNAVCQIYKITITNTSTAKMFVDGYVALTGGSGLPSDVPTTYTWQHNSTNTMRWAQVFSKGANLGYSTAGVQPLAANSPAITTYTTTTADTGSMAIASIDAPKATDNVGFNRDNIKTEEVYGDDENGTPGNGQVTIDGSSYDAVRMNYIRISDHAVTTPAEGPKTIDTGSGNAFTRADDQTSMLVINQQLDSVGETNAIREYYFVVWLTETGFDQTAGHTADVTSPTSATTTNPAANNFFNGIVSFTSAQGSEVTATFSGYTQVASDNT